VLNQTDIGEPSMQSQSEERRSAILGIRMKMKLNERWSYVLLLSIIVFGTGYLGLGVRMFASVVLSDSIFFAACGFVLLIFPSYFVIRRRAHSATNPRSLRRPRNVSPQARRPQKTTSATAATGWR
jgi:hypothetical protein